jgi:outer membrane receptor for ferrienterochelin and colicin
MYLIRYRYDKNGVYEMSNPNLAPPRTISYELGLASNVFKNIRTTVSGYYKDVTGEHGEVNYLNSNGSVNYDRWENNNYEDIAGFELNITKQDRSWLTGWVNFNYMLKKEGLTGYSEVREDISDCTTSQNNDFYHSLFSMPTLLLHCRMIYSQTRF